MSIARCKRAACVALSVAILACGAGKLPPGTPAGDRSVHFKKVDLYVQEGGETEDYDVRLIFDPISRDLRVTAEDRPESNTFASIPYDAITSMTYSNTESPRWKSGAGAAVAVGVFALPIFFLKGKKHWLTVTFEGVPSNPEGALVLKLDKNNFEQIIATVEAQAGVEVERVVES